MNEVDLSARLRLFAAIEGGSGFWCHEIAEKGPNTVLNELESDRYDEPTVVALRSRLKQLRSERLLEEVVEAGGFFLTPEDVEWPSGLRDLYSPPIGLVVKGDRSLLSQLDNSISIVGTRNPTDYGSRIASDFAIGVVENEWIVISGGAYGIDAAAHAGALAAKGRTVAVLASGVRSPYPAGNQRLFEEIARTGLLISEVMPSVKALPYRFLTRNRLIAAISKATVVVEAAYRSGSLRTARDASELMRLVLAVPGNITSPASAGCHRLIAERSAELVTSVTEVFDLVNPLA